VYRTARPSLNHSNKAKKEERGPKKTHPRLGRGDLPSIRFWKGWAAHAQPKETSLSHSSENISIVNNRSSAPGAGRYSSSGPRIRRAHSPQAQHRLTPRRRASRALCMECLRVCVGARRDCAACGRRGRRGRAEERHRFSFCLSLSLSFSLFLSLPDSYNCDDTIERKQ